MHLLDIVSLELFKQRKIELATDIFKFKPLFFRHTSVVLNLFDVFGTDDPIIISSDVTGERAVFFEVEDHLLVVNFFVVFCLVEVLHG